MFPGEDPEVPDTQRDLSSTRCRGSSGKLERRSRGRGGLIRPRETRARVVLDTIAKLTGAGKKEKIRTRRGPPDPVPRMPGGQRGSR